MSKLRIDVVLAQKGLFPSRAKAQDAIACGNVFVDGALVLQPSFQVEETVKVEVLRCEDEAFVSRAGEKLQRAVESFGLDFSGLYVLDVGASTGGFTQCALRHGAAHVTAVDVGHGQLHESLRQDKQVTSLEGVNARYLVSENLPHPGAYGAVVMDVSFISLTLVLPAVLQCVQKDAFWVCLIKPQFEAGREWVQKGVVKDAKVHKRVLKDWGEFVAGLGSLRAAHLCRSPILGQDGNVEFLVHLVPGVWNQEEWTKVVECIV